jgi:tetratricopeptide (TPR) repeat protein
MGESTMPADLLQNRLRQARRALADRDYRATHAHCMAVLKVEPGNAEALFLLGLLAADHRNFAKAAELFDRAIAASPRASHFHAHRARALLALNRQDDARRAADRARALKPADALTLDTIGVVYSRLGLHAEAVGLFEDAVARDPQNASYLYNLGAARQFLGAFEDAATCYARAIALDPQSHKSRLALVQLQKQTIAANHIDTLETMFAGAGDDALAALQIGHAIAKSLDDLGDYAGSLSWLVKAKAGKRRTRTRTRQDDAALFAAAAAQAAPARPDGYRGAQPIFIVGLPRTGTTLMDRILSSHGDVASAGERTEFALLVKRRTATPSHLVLDTETLRAADKIDFARLGADYAAALAPHAEGRPRLIDKMPLNFFYAGLIHRALPEARIICLRRDPMDSIVSNYRQLFATEFPYYDYAYDLEDTAHYYVRFDRLMAHWRARLPPERFTEVRYETLVADQEGETRRVLAFCGLDWDARCLAFHENAAPVATASSVQVRQPLYASSVGRWKKFGDALEPAVRILRAAHIPLEA